MSTKRDLGVLLLILSAGGMLACPGLERNPLAGHDDEGVPVDAGATDAAAAGADASAPGTTSGLCGIIGSGGVRAIAPLADGSTFAIGYSNGRIAFYSTGPTTGVPRTLSAHSAAITLLRVSPDGTLLGSASENGELKLWNVADGKLRRVVAGPGPEVSGFAFSPDAATLALLYPGHVDLQNTASGAPLWTQPTQHGGGTIFFPADGKTLIHGGDILTVRDATGGELKRELPVAPYGVRAISFDGAALLGFRSRDSSMRVLRASDGAPVWTRPLPEAANVLAGAFSRDGTAAAIVTREGHAWVVDTADGHLIRTFSLEDGAGAAVAYSSDSQLLAVGLAQGALRIWQLATGELKVKEPILPGHTGAVSKVAFSADGELVGSISGASPAADRALKVWRTSDAALLHSSIRDPQDGARKSFAFSPDSAVVALTGGVVSNRIHLLRASDGTELRTIEGDATDLAISPDGSLLAASSYCINCAPVAVRVWRVADGTEAPGFGLAEKHGGGVVVFSPDGQLLAATSRGNLSPSPASVAVWKVADRALLWSAPGATMPFLRLEPEAAAFSPDATLLALGSPEAAAVRIYRAQDGTPVTELGASGILGVAFSPSGTLLAAAGDEGLRLWRTSDWSLFGEVPGQFTAVTFSPDGKTVLVAGRDGVLRLFCSVAQPLL